MVNANLEVKLIFSSKLLLAVFFLFTMIAATFVGAQPNQEDEKAIRNIIDEEVTTWNKGDATGYSQHFAEDGTFTNILGVFYTGHKTFLARHEEIFKGRFRGTHLQQEVVSLRFIRPDVAIAENLSTVSGFSSDGPPPGAPVDKNGALHTRLLQVFTKDANRWKIVAYHNVDVKPAPPAPK